jgi:CheY-like chemotaxis protein
MASSSYKIAIIEDNAPISQMYRTKFELAGHKVAVAVNGIEGLDVVKNTTPDIILLDIMMPEMNGDECLARIRKIPKFQDIPVVVMTNLGEEEAPPKLAELGVVKYIVKADTPPRQVVEIVENILKNQKK